MELQFIYELFMFLSFLVSLPLLGFIGSGAGTDLDPYLITNMDELNDVRNEPDAIYRLENDLDAGAETDNSGGTYWNAGAGWLPIGIDFDGEFRGNGKTIDGLFIRRAGTENVGLFDKLTSTSIVSELKFTNPDIQGGASTGVLAGSVSAADVDRVEVRDALVDAAGSRYSCFVGRADGAATFDNCSATGTLEATLAGGDTRSGFVNNSTNDPDYNKCWSAVTFNGSRTEEHGFADRSFNTYNDCFWDTTIGIATSDGGTGKTTSEMQNVDTFTDTATTGLSSPYDFVGTLNDDAGTDDYWDINTGEYPHLTAFVSAPADTTAPTYTVDGVITKGTILHNTVQLNYAKAQDETSAQTALTYKMFVSATNNLITDATTVKANGVEVASGTDVATLTSSDLSALGSPFNPGDSLYANIVAYDEAGNGLIYNQVQIYLQAIYGNVQINASPRAGVEITIETVDGVEGGNPTILDNVVTDGSGNWWLSVEYDPTVNYRVIYSEFLASYTGTLTSATTSSFTDTGVFTAGEFDDGQAIVRITSGAADGDERRVTGNADTDTCDIDGSWTATPSVGDAYEVGYMYSDEVKFKPPKA